MAMQYTNLPGFRALQTSHDIICQSSLDPLEFSNKMLQEGIINSGVWNDVRAKQARSEQIAVILNAIKSNGGKGVFETVIKHIKFDSSNAWLADRLDATYKEGQRLSASTSQGSPDPPVHKHLPGPSSRLSSPPDNHPSPPDADHGPTLAEPISHSPSPDPALEKSINELEEKFLEVVRVIQVDCEYVDIRDIKTYVTLIPAVMKQEHVAFLMKHKQDIAQASSVIEIITLLNLYWDCFNYGLLEHLVEKCGRNQTKELMKQFVRDMKAFMKETKLADFMRIWRGREEVPPGFSKLIARHGLDPKQTTLRQVDHFRKDFCQHYSLHQMVLIFRSVHPGSVAVVWLIPSHVVEHLCAELKNPEMGYKVLTQYSVLEVLIDEVRVFVYASGKEEEKMHEESDDGDGDDPEESTYNDDADITYDFVEKPSEDYFCPVMQGLLTNPYQSSCCGNQFSKEAVTQLQQLQKPCPMCRRKRMTFNVDKAWKRKVWSVKIYCPSKQDAGCTWSGEISELKRHLKDLCPGVKVPCPSGCGQEVLRGKMEDHRAKSCPKRPFSCMYCNKLSTYDEISNIHLVQCSTELIQCPNNCGDGSIQRQHLQDHIKICPSQQVSCEYSFAGCEVQVVRAQLPSHMKEATERHLLLVTKYSFDHIAVLKKKVELLASTNIALSHLVPIAGPEFVMYEFSERQTSGKSWFSRPFYSHVGGYKFCLRVEAGGVDAGKGVYLGVAVHLMKGEYDDNLTFPFCGDITIQLANQSRESAHHCTKTLNLTKACGNKVVGRVTTEGDFARNDGWTQTEFVLLEDLKLNKSLSRQYLKNDCLKFRVLSVVLCD